MPRRFSLVPMQLWQRFCTAAGTEASNDDIIVICAGMLTVGVGRGASWVIRRIRVLDTSRAGAGRWSGVEACHREELLHADGTLSS